MRIVFLFLTIIIGTNIIAQQNVQEIIYTDVQKRPHFRGGKKALMDTIYSNLRYPANAEDMEKEVKVLVQFHLDTLGRVRDPFVISSPNPGFDEEALKVISALPDWVRAYNYSTPVNVYLTLPIIFKVRTKGNYSYYKGIDPRKAHPNSMLDLFTNPDEMPEFPGGFKKMEEFIYNEMKYPKKALKKNISGDVYVVFYIDGFGMVRRAYVAGPVDQVLKKEAKRIVNKMPYWKPGKHDGVIVNTVYTIKITFDPAKVTSN